MFFIDPMYLVFILPGLLLSLWATFRVKRNFSKYSQVPSMRGLTGAEAADLMLRRAGIAGVEIQEAEGLLSDHYNPMNKTLNLSADVYHSNSVASIGVACHEAGHAIQHARNYR